MLEAADMLLSLQHRAEAALYTTQTGKECDANSTGTVRSTGLDNSQPPSVMAGAEAALDAETIQTLLDLLNPLHGSLDEQTYDDKVRENFDAPRDAEYEVKVTAQMERDLTRAVCILENCKRTAIRSGARRGRC